MTLRQQDGLRILLLGANLGTGVTISQTKETEKQKQQRKKGNSLFMSSTCLHKEHKSLHGPKPD